ncbi:MAG: type IV secretion system DNA-binding domain-containing protein [Fimbriimonadaceae bacterium]|nr:type IV secretion system DNA-binding domain-containing protein [Fimbriimonadaceae bacterium]
MWDSVSRVGLKFAGGVLVPLLMGWSAYEVLSAGLDWPPTVALVAGIALGWLGWKTAKHQLGPGASSAHAIRTMLTSLGAFAVAGVGLLVVRQVLLWAHWLPGTAMLLACLVGLVVLVVTNAVATDRGSSTFLRGRRVVGAWVAKRRIEQRRRRSTSSDPCPVWFGVQLPPEAAGTHWMVAGMNGSGKTTTIKILMQSVLPVIGTGRGHRALVYDDKQDLYPFLHAIVDPARIVTLNPFDKRCHGWDIAADVRSPAAARQIAATLIPERAEARETYFDDAARDLIAGVMTVFIQLAGQQWTFRDLILALETPARMQLVLSQTPETASLVETYLVARSASDIITTIRTKIGPLRPVAAAWHRAELISLQDWLNGEGILVLSNDEQVREPLQVINQVLFDRLAQLLLSQAEPVTGRTWVFIDELREARRLERVSDLLLRGRSKKVSVVIGFQAIEGVREVYRPNVADELTGQCRTAGLMVLDSVPSREWAAKVIGEAEYLDVNRSLGGQHPSGSEQRQRRDVVMPSEFAELPRLQDDGVLAGWCLTPYSPPFYTELRGQELDRWSVEEPEVDSYQRRGAEEQYLGQWTAEDYLRLHLPQPAEPAAPPAPVEPVEPTPAGPELAPLPSGPAEAVGQTEPPVAPILEAPAPEPPPRTHRRTFNPDRR